MGALQRSDLFTRKSIFHFAFRILRRGKINAD